MLRCPSRAVNSSRFTTPRITPSRISLPGGRGIAAGDPVGLRPARLTIDNNATLVQTFTAEYAGLFDDAAEPGRLRRAAAGRIMNFAPPYRRVGAWDPYIVTETPTSACAWRDAATHCGDRLTTYEEAPVKIPPWLKQHPLVQRLMDLASTCVPLRLGASWDR